MSGNLDAERRRATRKEREAYWREKLGDRWNTNDHQPRPANESLIQKGRAFLAAVSGPRTSDQEYARRMAACEVCPYVQRWQGYLYCRACGCPRWHLARLDVKLRLQNLECPADRW